MPSTQLKTLLNRIHNQDCVQGLQRIADNSVHLAFADPPFNIGYKYDVYHDSQESMHYLQWCNQWMAELFRVLKPDGTFWLAIGDEYAAELKISAQSLGFQLRSWVIWYYTFGVHCTNKFTRSHAHLFYFTKHPKNFTFNREEISVPSARQLIYGDKRANPRGRVPDDTWILRPQDAQDSFQADEDIWYFPRVNGTFKERAGFHGCQMPEQLLGRIIRGCSNENDVVLDPFSGSATTLVVAKKLHRKFIGFELSDDYALRGTERLDRTLAGDKLEGAEDPKTSVKATTTKANPREESLQINSLRRGFDPSFMRALDPHHIEPLRKAFLKASQGQRAGQTIIDPTLNTEFQNACDELAIELSGLERNVGILQLSSRGELDLPSGADEPSPIVRKLCEERKISRKSCRR